MPADSACCPLAASAAALLPALAEDLLGRGTRIRLAVGGVSMAPWLRDGDYVIVEPLHRNKARFGDLVLFRNAGGALVLHRVIRRWRNARGLHRLQTRGDANIRLDASVETERVLGRVRLVERNGGDRIDLESAGQRLRALVIGAGMLLGSALYYKLAVERKG